MIHERTDDDSIRCEGTTGKGPCPYKRVEGSRFCAVHGGSKALQNNQKRALRVFLGGQWAAKIGQFAEDPALKTLNQEIGILRMLLDGLLRRCQTESDLMMRSSSISELVSRIEKTVLSCHQIELKTGEMLSRTQLADFGSKMVEIIAELVEDPTVVDEITKRLVASIADAGQVSEAQKLIA